MKKADTTKLSTILKEYAYKVTPTRLSILSTFMRVRKPLSAEHILKHVRKTERKADQVTVYRTLTSFEKKGLIKKVNLRTDAAFYELAFDHHHHVVCTSCGRVEDFTDCSISHIIEKVTRTSPYFKTIDDHSIELFGMCTTCVR